MGFYKGKKILVTGNTGFKGTWLTQVLLRLGAQVTGIGLEPNTSPAVYDALNQRTRIRENIVDIRDFDKVLDIFKAVKPEIVFHLAAQPLVIESYRNPRYTYDVNAMGTVNICECVRLTDSVKSFVNVTTDKVYRNNEWEYPYRETDYLDGYDPYSNSKSCSELITASYKRSFLDEKGVAVSRCRAGNVIGGGDFSDNRIIPDCYRALSVGKSIEIRNPNSIRPYQHVLEAVTFYMLVAKKQYNDKVFSGEYNVGPEGSDCITTREMTDLFCKAWGEGVSWHPIPYEGPHEANLLKLDTSRAKMLFHWKPIWDVNRAVEEASKWYRVFSENGDVIGLTDEQIRAYLEEAKDWWDERDTVTSNDR